MTKEVPSDEGSAPTTSDLLKLIHILEARVKKLEQIEQARRDAYERLRPL